MSANATSSNDISLSSEFHCLFSKPGCFIFTTFTFTNVLLLLPLCVFVLQRWGKQSFSTAASFTHSDSFTHHLVLMELLDIFGCILCCIGIYSNDVQMVMAWFYVSSITFYGGTFFHLLTCVEHYLAAVHPITYMSLREERWIRIRNIIIGCIWLLSLGWTGLISTGNGYLIPDVCLLVLSVVIISFCSLSVVRVLMHPGPGQGRDRTRADQSRQRAFYTIVAILGVLLLRCGCSLAGALQSVVYGVISDCLVMLCAVWLNLAGSLVLPVLYVQRTGSLACCRRTDN